MLDPKFIRENPEKVKKSIVKRGFDASVIDQWIDANDEFRKLKSDLDSLRHSRNLISEEINQLNKAGEKKEVKTKVEEAKEIAKKIRELEEKEKQVYTKLQELGLSMPNLIPLDLPEKEKIISKNGKEKKEKWQKDYMAIVKELELVDFDSAIRMSGEGFFILTGKGAELRRALINFFLDSIIKRGYKEICHPILINESSALASGHLPKFREGMYRTTDNLFLAPTEELPLANIYAGHVLKEEELPINLTSYMPSFRTEKGATRPIIRSHQFDEVEIFKLTKQETSNEELQKMIEDASSLLKQLKLPFIVKLLPGTDMAFPANATYDIDVFTPITGMLEVSSCSNCLDFQSRRAKIFYIEKNEKKFVHTLNGTALGLNRVFIAILENYQQKDGSILIPAVLQKYTGFKIIKAKEQVKEKKSEKKVIGKRNV